MKIIPAYNVGIKTQGFKDGKKNFESFNTYDVIVGLITEVENLAAERALLRHISDYRVKLGDIIEITSIKEI